MIRRVKSDNPIQVIAQAVAANKTSLAVSVPLFKSCTANVTKAYYSLMWNKVDLVQSTNLLEFLGLYMEGGGGGTETRTVMR